MGDSGITIEESYRSPRVGSEASELEHVIQGTGDYEVAYSNYAEFIANNYAFFNGLYLTGIEVEPINDSFWLGRAHYSRRQQEKPEPATGNSFYSFDTSGATMRIYNSLETIAGNAAEGLNSVPNFSRSIGVTADGVEGVDIVVPTFAFEETHYLHPSSVNNTFIRNLFELTGCVNNAPFRNFAAGECLFLGARGSLRRNASEDWEINFRFAASPNQSSVTIGDITLNNKRGWDYVWAYYERQEDESNHLMVMRPIAAYIERVYRDGNFALLGIGTT